MEPREKLDQARDSDFTVRPGAVWFTLPQSSLSFKESIQASSSASERLLAVFLSELESGRKDCLTSCHQHVRKLGCLGNYRFPMVFPLFFSRNFYFFWLNKSLIKIAQHSSPQKCRKPWLCIYFLEMSPALPLRSCCPLLTCWHSQGTRPIHPDSWDSIYSPRVNLPCTSTVIPTHGSWISISLVWSFSPALHTHHLLNNLRLFHSCLSSWQEWLYIP